jgi:hypothetical protein
MCSVGSRATPSTASGEIGDAVAARAPRFYDGRIVDVNRGSRVRTVRGDDTVKWRFLVTSAAQIQRHFEHPIPATFDHLKVGLRVRILAGSPTMNPRSGRR